MQFLSCHRRCSKLLSGSDKLDRPIKGSVLVTADDGGGLASLNSS